MGTEDLAVNTLLFFDASYKSLAYKCHVISTYTHRYNYSTSGGLGVLNHALMAPIRLYKVLCYIPLSSTFVTSDQLRTFLLKIQDNSFLWQKLATCFHEDKVLLFMETMIIIFGPGSLGFRKIQ